MTTKAFAEAQASLLESRADWERRLDAIRADRRHERAPLDSNLDDQATQRENDDTLDALDELGRKELAEIDLALGRIQSGTFGQCLGCRESIPEDRLRANPAAARCLDCME